MGPLEDRFGIVLEYLGRVIWGSPSSRLLIVLGTCWDRFGEMLGIMRSLSTCFVILLDECWNRLGSLLIVLGLLWDCFGVALGCFEIVLGPFLTLMFDVLGILF